HRRSGDLRRRHAAASRNRAARELRSRAAREPHRSHRGAAAGIARQRFPAPEDEAFPDRDEPASEPRERELWPVSCTFGSMRIRTAPALALGTLLALSTGAGLAPPVPDNDPLAAEIGRWSALLRDHAPTGDMW